MTFGVKIRRDVKKMYCNAIVSRHFVTKLLPKISVTRPVKSSVVLIFSYNIICSIVKVFSYRSTLSLLELKSRNL